MVSVRSAKKLPGNPAPLARILLLRLFVLCGECRSHALNIGPNGDLPGLGNRSRAVIEISIAFHFSPSMLVLKSAYLAIEASQEPNLASPHRVQATDHQDGRQSNHQKPASGEQSHGEIVTELPSRPPGICSPLADPELLAQHLGPPPRNVQAECSQHLARSRSPHNL